MMARYSAQDACLWWERGRGGEATPRQASCGPPRSPKRSAYDGWGAGRPSRACWPCLPAEDTSGCRWTDDNDGDCGRQFHQPPGTRRISTGAATTREEAEEAEAAGSGGGGPAAAPHEQPRHVQARRGEVSAAVATCGAKNRELVAVDGAYGPDTRRAVHAPHGLPAAARPSNKHRSPMDPRKAQVGGLQRFHNLAPWAPDPARGHADGWQWRYLPIPPRGWRRSVGRGRRLQAENGHGCGPTAGTRGGAMGRAGGDTLWRGTRTGGGIAVAGRRPARVLSVHGSEGLKVRSRNVLALSSSEKLMTASGSNLSWSCARNTSV